MSVQSMAPSEGIEDFDEAATHMERVSAVTKWLEGVQHTAPTTRELPDGALVKAERPKRKALSTNSDPGLAAWNIVSSVEVDDQDRVSDSSPSLLPASTILQDNLQQQIKTHKDTGSYCPPRVTGLPLSASPAVTLGMGPSVQDMEEGRADLLSKRWNLPMDYTDEPLRKMDFDAFDINKGLVGATARERPGARPALLKPRRSKEQDPSENSPPVKGWRARLPRLFNIKGPRIG
ncbi:hypothetical protein LTR78_004258 [Recurvomyces mirabilis]|uniref:Uncharacterized protein n=1 Tax=Recurvomyces mirabilis TaxID=574656 RepID=A0AAE0WQN4_9PEZI|nr:hypothetical protein LTR78_004258 [Recurvomyces mirabilis]